MFLTDVVKTQLSYRQTFSLCNHLFEIIIIFNAYYSTTNQSQSITDNNQHDKKTGLSPLS